MWTLTFSALHSDWECARLFSSFLDHLRKVIGQTGWGGLRVAELHRTHGVHYHMLITERIHVSLMRRIGRCHGFGRIHVCRAVKDSASYLIKYLHKQRQGPRTESGRSARKWASFGDIGKTRVKDTWLDSPMWRYRRANKLNFLNYASEIILHRCWIEFEDSFKMCWQKLKEGDKQGAWLLATGKAFVNNLGMLVFSAPPQFLDPRRCPF